MGDASEVQCEEFQIPVHVVVYMIYTQCHISRIVQHNTVCKLFNLDRDTGANQS